jgi:hypothetical protein
VGRPDDLLLAGSADRAPEETLIESWVEQGGPYLNIDDVEWREPSAGSDCAAEATSTD